MVKATPALAAWAHRVLSGVIVLLHSNDDISLFVSLVNVPVGLDDLLQGIASVNDRFDLARFNEFFEVHEIFSLWGCCPTYECPAACHPRPEHLHAERWRSDRLQIDSIFLE
jgi:hypothetical protein